MSSHIHPYLCLWQGFCKCIFFKLDLCNAARWFSCRIDPHNTVPCLRPRKAHEKVHNDVIGGCWSYLAANDQSRTACFSTCSFTHFPNMAQTWLRGSYNIVFKNLNLCRLWGISWYILHIKSYKSFLDPQKKITKACSCSAGQTLSLPFSHPLAAALLSDPGIRGWWLWWLWHWRYEVYKPFINSQELTPSNVINHPGIS